MWGGRLDERGIPAKVGGARSRCPDAHVLEDATGGRGDHHHTVGQQGGLVDVMRHEEDRLV
jgi:hypothetical protein